MGKTSLLAACQAQRTFGDKSSLDPGLSTLVTISFSELTNTLMLIINHYVNYYKKKSSYCGSLSVIQLPGVTYLKCLSIHEHFHKLVKAAKCQNLFKDAKKILLSVSLRYILKIVFF